MEKPVISMIAAIQKKDRGLGKNNTLLYRIPDDLKRFKTITKGHPIIMGRKTFESIGRPLPDRTNIIITRNPEYKQENCIVVMSLEDAIKEARKNSGNEIFIIGGAEMYTQALPFADKLYLTLVDGDLEADAFFPDYSGFTKEVFREDHMNENPAYSFVDLEK